jgi:hypothetical protein
MVDDLCSLEEIGSVEEIRTLRARFVRFVDTQEWGAWRELLTEDYRLETDDGVQEGRDGIVEFVSSALDGASIVHQLFGPDITITGRDTAIGTWGYEDRVVFPGEHDPIVLHDYGYLRDEYVRTEDGWRVRSTVETKLQASDI